MCVWEGMGEGLKILKIEMQLDINLEMELRQSHKLMNVYFRRTSPQKDKLDMSRAPIARTKKYVISGISNPRISQN